MRFDDDEINAIAVCNLMMERLGNRHQKYRVAVYLHDRYAVSLSRPAEDES